MPIDRAASCWLAAAGGFAYTANGGSGSIGIYAVAPDGTLSVLGTTLVENNSASHPLDEGVSVGQNYLYVLADRLSQIVGYRVGDDGSLTQKTPAPAAAGSRGIGANEDRRPQTPRPVGGGMLGSSRLPRVSRPYIKSRWRPVYARQNGNAKLAAR